MYIVWLYNQKAFDSVKHKWLLRSLQLAKVPIQLLSAIENLTNESVITDIIKYHNGIFQGDTLSVLLFV